MYITVKVVCRVNDFSYREEEKVEREMNIDVNDRQIYSLHVGNTADAMLQDAAVELMLKLAEQKEQVEQVPM